MSNSDYIYMLESAKDHLDEIEKIYTQCLKSDFVPKSLTNKIRYFLLDIESALDYISFVVFNKYCLPSLLEKGLDNEKIEKLKKKVNFPLFDYKEWFDKDMRKTFPNLDNAKPEIINLFEKHQKYKTSSEYWLTVFNRLVNNNKHRELEKQTRRPTGYHIKYHRDKNGIFENIKSNGPNGILTDGGPLLYKALTSNPLNNTKATFWVIYTFKSTGYPVISTLKSIYEQASITIEEIRNVIEE